MLDSRTALYDLTRGHRLRYVLAIAALGAAIGLSLLVPLVARRAVDDLLATGADFRRLAVAALAIVALTAATGVFVYLRSRWAAEASEGVARALRNRLYDQLQRLPSAYHDRADTGDLVQRATSDVETVRGFLAVQVVEIGRAALLLAGVVPLMFWLDAMLAWVAVSLLAPILAWALLFFPRVQGAYLASDEAEAALTSRMQENLTGIRVVRAFARQRFEGDKFAARNVRYRDLSERLIALLGNYWALSDLLCVGQIGLVAMFGAHRLQTGAFGAGTLYAFLSYTYLFVGPVRHMGRLLADMGKASVALGRIRDVLEAEPETDREVPACGAGPTEGRIAARGLTFAYRDDGQPALFDVSFDLAPGETLALVGPPGAGKSTLAQLLVRLYEYREGSLTLDGREVRELPRASLRARVGCVLQEPFLFSKTVRENLVIGRPEASAEAAEESARLASLHDAILSFEHGYDTLVGERGVTLSGGQRQRVALARALLLDPPVLVLDDTLSAVDTVTEARILEALRARRGRRTTIVIAHRLTTLAHADQLLVLDRGKVIESGRPADLLRRDGPFRRLWRIQTSLEEEIGREAGDPRARSSVGVEAAS